MYAIIKNGGKQYSKDKKVIIFKKRRRKDSKVKRGFRRQYTKVRVLSIKA